MTTDIVLAAWPLLGVAGMLFWWTRDGDFRSEDLPFLVMGAILGPFAWLLGWRISYEIRRGDVPDRPLLRRRDKQR